MPNSQINVRIDDQIARVRRHLESRPHQTLTSVIVEELCSLYSSEWDGSNHVAQWSDEERVVDLAEAIERAITEYQPFDAHCGSLWDASEWLDASPPQVAADATNKQLADLATELQEEAHSEGVHLHGLEEYLEGLWGRE